MVHIPNIFLYSQHLKTGAYSRHIGKNNFCVPIIFILNIFFIFIIFVMKRVKLIELSVSMLLFFVITHLFI